MTDKQRKVKKEEIFHNILKGNKKAVGKVDSSDMAALGNILKTRMKNADIHGLTPKELVKAQRVIASDTGADPSLAVREIKEQMERNKKRRRR